MCSMSGGEDTDLALPIRGSAGCACIWAAAREEAGAADLGRSSPPAAAWPARGLDLIQNQDFGRRKISIEN